ncbi:hypothetical protein NE236_30445 [Actinoallomurus purpureus]|uniref:hypothetical protein n=1 Tax=Actinoallomurus purpureus TaxID=478114 RepID=UPI0020934A2E|nr:hypothetical protein [Actinoallomurus purpureus]MCO6009300.1 hypothetical protein [Actinoallomurus purpureus]
MPGIRRPDGIRRRCAFAAVRLTRGDPGYDDGAIVPYGDWQPLTDADIEQLQPACGNPHPLVGQEQRAVDPRMALAV